MNWPPFKKRPKEDNIPMEKIEQSLPFGAHKHLDLVVQETGLTREEVLGLEGVTYSSINDQVRRDKSNAVIPKRFLKYVKQ